MKTFILHIGQHRTGTSSLQVFLDSNRNRLLKQGILYPTSGKTDMEGNAHTRHLYLSFRDQSDHDTLQQLSDEVLNSDANRVILSAEGFCRASINRKIKENLADIVQFFSNYNIKAVCYLRPQESFIESFYNWRVKSGIESRKFDDFVDNFLDEWKNYLNYDKLLEPFSDLLGRDNVMVRIFNRETLHNNSIVHDFCRTLGIEISNAFSINQSEVNISIPYSVLEITRTIKERLNHPTEKFEELSLFISQVLELQSINSSNTGLSMLPYEKRLKIRKYFEESNNSVAQRYLGVENLFENPKTTKYVPAEKLMQFNVDDLLLVIVELWHEYLKTSKTVSEIATDFKLSLNDYITLQRDYKLLQQRFLSLEKSIK